MFSMRAHTVSPDFGFSYRVDLAPYIVLGVESMYRGAFY